ncbi:MAG: glycosyltransferase family 2 protein [Patescibacteria group bacterium]|nr:glycosyltransferase family 2 protein [Patescibacteria group bacterium]
MPRLELSIIIVSWNVSKHLNICLNSIYKNSENIEFEIIVIDNNSKDNTLSLIKKKFPQVKLISNKKNFGFATAVNQGLAQSKGKYLLLLNPDTVLLPDTLKKSLTYMKKNHFTGVMGPKILNSDLSLQPSCRRFPTTLSQTLILLKIHHIFPKLRSLRKYLMQDFDYKESKEVDQVMGAYFLIRRSVLEKVGGFDENFYILFEEVDFCRRVKEVGLKVDFYPLVKIIHHGGESFKKVKSIRSQINFNRSLLYYFKKYHSSFSYYWLALLTPLSLFLALLTPFFAVFQRKN